MRGALRYPTLSQWCRCMLCIAENKKMNGDLVYAPWTPQQVEALNRWQKAGSVHPFTCGAAHEEGDRDLIAREDGWHCPTCGYQQKWAHRMMFNTPPPSRW